jgi:prepilin-type N-terminal cleavage/methylation domain-containing protein
MCIRPTARSKAAFTLLEVVLAMALIGLMLVAGLSLIGVALVRSRKNSANDG